MNKKRLGESLLDAGLITKKQLEYALDQQWRNCNLGKLGQILLGLKCIDEDTLIEFLSKQYGTPGINLLKQKIDEKAIYMIPRETAEKYNVIPVGFKLQGTKKRLIVAMTNPLDLKVIDNISFISGYGIEPIYAREEDLKWIIAYYYGRRELMGSQRYSGNSVLL
jgi:type IV pilus assembly protein PilB